MAPGRQEDEARTPFVGPSGQLLKESLYQQGIAPQTVYMTNTVHCRPITPEGGNRDPEAYELSQCRGWLEAEVALVNPRVILLLGKTAIPLGFPGERPSEASGKARAAVWCESIRLFVGCYHPAAILRQRGLRQEFDAAVRLAAELVKET